MSGRTSKPGRGGGNRSRWNNKRKVPSKKEKTKKSLSDYNYYLGNAKQASDYETTTEFLINYIKKTFTDGGVIAKVLKDLEPADTDLWRPTLQTSTSTDAATKAAEDKQFEMEFKLNYSDYTTKRNQYQENLIKAYAVLWERCTSAMQNKIQMRKDFDTKIEDDPIELLKAIKEHALNFQEYRYSMSIIADAMRNLLNTRQQKEEMLKDYSKRFKTAEEILQSHVGGPIIFTKYIKEMNGYDPTKPDVVEALTAEAYEQYLAYLYLEQADQSKYGSILKGLATQKSLGNEQYPKTVAEASNVLSNHKFDEVKSKPGKSKPKGNDNKKNEQEEEEEDVKLSFAQIEGKCYCCGKKGHMSPDCKQKDKTPREDWWINKVQQHIMSTTDGISSVSDSQASSGTTTAKDDKTKDDKSKSAPSTGVAWVGVHVQLQQSFNAQIMKNWILLDSQSSATIFCNPDYVENIRRVPFEQGLVVNTNGGPFTVQYKADLPMWGEVWFDKNSMTNIFSHAEMADRYRITYDNHMSGDTFYVHTPEKKVKFDRLTVNLYVHKPKGSEKPLPSSVMTQLVNTLEENRSFYTARQFDRAKRARDFYHAIGTPSIQDLKSVVRMNIVGNNPVTTKDIMLAEKIFGPDIGALKGKTPRRTPAPVVDDMIEIPRALQQAHREVTLCIDGLKVNGVAFLSTISQNLCYRTSQWIEHQTAAKYRDALSDIFRIYHRATFRITRIHADNEFRPLIEDLEDDFGITINFANPQEHVPEAERNNRVIKERVRTNYHRLPYKRLPHIMVRVLVQESTKKLNFFPAKQGVSQYYSPRMILHQKNLDYERHCKYAFGTFVQAHNEPEPTNTNAPRTLDCIYLRYNDSDQGGHVCLHLPTNRVLTRRRVTPIPITPAVIVQVDTVAAQQNMPPGLKITNRYDVVLYDSAWIAGVDFVDSDYESDYSDDEDAETSDEEDDDDDHGYPDDPDDDAIPAGDAGDDEDAQHYDNLDEDYQELDVMEDIPNPGGDDEEDPQALDPGVQDDPVLIPGVQEEEEDEPPQGEAVHQGDEDNNPAQVVPEPENPVAQQVGEIPPPQPPIATRAGRIVRPPPRYDDYQMAQPSKKGPYMTMQYTEWEGRLIAVILTNIESLPYRWNQKIASQFMQNYGIKAGIRKFGSKGKSAALAEMKQLEDREVFYPVHSGNLTMPEKKRGMESLLFIVEKRDGRIKARFCANGSVQRQYVDREDAASPTAMTESILITAVIDAKQGRDVMTADIPNAFVQTEINRNDVGKRVVMKIRGLLVDILVELNPGKYEKYVKIDHKGRKLLYVVMSKALYGMLESSLLYYKKFKNDMERIGFWINPYDPCVANRIVDGKQHTVTWHVDDLKSSHVDPKVNDDFLEWLNDTYGDVIEVKATRGKKHDYLAMNLDYSIPGKVQVDMREYVEKMVTEFPAPLKNNVFFPWNDKLFKVDPKSKRLETERSKVFHTFVMKGMFVCKRGRQDIHVGISFMATRVKEATEQDWIKLKRLMSFLKTTQTDVATLEAGDVQCNEWWVDAAFAVHPDMRSHTGAIHTLGKGAISSVSSKQKTNSRSSTEAELIGLDDVISKVLWSKRFIMEQGFDLRSNVVYRDNTSSMKLEQNGRASASKRTRHFHIKWFYATDLIERKEIEIKYCPTDQMIADYHTKPLTGVAFLRFRGWIMNFQDQMGQQECVGDQESTHNNGRRMDGDQLNQEVG